MDDTTDGDISDHDCGDGEIEEGNEDDEDDDFAEGESQEDFERRARKGKQKVGETTTLLR